MRNKGRKNGSKEEGSGEGEEVGDTRKEQWTNGTQTLANLPIRSLLELSGGGVSGRWEER